MITPQVFFKITGAISEVAEQSITHDLEIDDSISLLVTTLLDNRLTDEAIFFFITFIDNTVFKLSPMYLTIFNAIQEQTQILEDKIETLKVIE